MDYPLISIIMPIYNAEKYLEKAINSIRTQTYCNLEIMLVDDGSTDGSLNICRSLAKEDDRITVFHKENGGQASARNLALDHAKGAYFGFVDADDWIAPNMYEVLYKRMCATGSDIAICNFELVTEHGHKAYWTDNLNEDVVFYNNMLMEEILYNKRVNEMFWNKLFSKETIASERFIEGMIFEDTEMMHRCLAHAKKAVYIGKPLYYNYMSENSTTRQKIKPKTFDRVTANLNRIEFYQKNYPQYVTIANTAYVDVCLDLIDLSRKSEECKIIRKKTIDELRIFLKDHDVTGSKKAALSKFAAKFGKRFFYVAARSPYWIFGILRAVKRGN